MRSPAEQAIFDAWLMGRFPGRTLEDLDDMDMGRFLRAVEAQQVMELERRYRQYLQGTIKELPPDDWKVIRQHERLIAEHGVN